MGSRGFMKMRDFAGYWFVSELDNFDRSSIARKIYNRYWNGAGGTSTRNPLDNVKDMYVTRLNDKNSPIIYRELVSNNSRGFTEVSLESGYVKNSIFISEIVIELSNVFIGDYKVDYSLTPMRENIQLLFSKIIVRGL